MKQGSSADLYLASHNGGLHDFKVNELPVFNEYFVPPSTSTANVTAAQPGHDIGLISSDEESSDSDF